MHIILTGATGTLGSQVLFSLLETRFSEIEQLVLIVRKKQRISPINRVKNMLESPMAPLFIKENLAAVHHKLMVVDADQVLQPQNFLRTNIPYYLIHSAGYVNLSIDPNSREEIFRENLTFTQHIFKAYTPYLRKFIYISTAFSAGKLEGLLNDDYVGLEQQEYRNFYEASKHAAEKFLVSAGKSSHIDVQVLRPSVLGGNILDKPTFFISKYMVFYLFAKFFHRSNSKDSVRIQANADSKLNIIPTDYAAKVITKVFDTAVEQLNIVNSKGTEIFTGISKILETVNFKNFNLTQELLETATEFESTLERFYYETIGIHLTPYLTAKPYEWDTTLLESILPIPQYNLEDYLVNTIEYAKINGFRNQRW
ncbi:Male sterility domain protein [Croceitalea dokdonensis DOKDO 023]|uniref:Male sterility domain protein n=1 Tax=Croceitalea dokdonensis DOKDO 023 TaxID=1300341 RepID=A0A0P7AW20_9FLAO|nr:SDR family oxidoreductase [Croceitalea dokdonensis]KPM32858.1 Male sterility domain protein [Croceitalea dokdonensis DOKDO 023]